MKTLLILRHAKAQADAPNGDRKRTLTKRGRRDAAAMADHIAAKLGRPDAIVTSDATRARETADAVAAATGFDAPLTIEPDVYAADLDTLVAVVRGLPDAADSVVLVGHNPGFEELTAALAGVDEDEVRLPTAGLARLELDVARWNDAAMGAGRLQDIETPGGLAR
ncbi:MAG TPA: histidine phosphatase family protein [Thermomicrobiales bacterium]|nr:histidine phosphatase family protein [Thermomicrobiales bacterium]